MESWDDEDWADYDAMQEEGSEKDSENDEASCSDFSIGGDVFLVTVHELHGKGDMVKKVVGVFDTHKKAMIAVRYAIKRVSGYYPKTGPGKKPYVIQDNSDEEAAVDGCIYSESNEYDESKKIWLAKIALNSNVFLKLN